MRAEYCTSRALLRRKLACSASGLSGRSARAYGCHARSPRMPRTVLRSSCNCRAISDFDRLSAWNSRCTSRQQSSRTMRPSPRGVPSGPVSAVAAVAPVNNVSVITTALLREEGGEFSMTTDGDYWVTADTRHQDESAYLLTGFTRCSVCGGPIGTDLRAHGSAGRRRHVAFYTCLDRKRRGPAICTNAVT